MRVWLKQVSLALIIFLVMFQAIRPSRINPPSYSGREINASLTVNPSVAAIFSRSCNDCHSNHTIWPWYSGIAPVSWLVARDVREGRRRLNFSEWDAHNRENNLKLLDEICSEVSGGEMPGWGYSLLHPQAKISPTDAQTICSWTRTAAQALSATRIGSKREVLK